MQDQRTALLESVMDLEARSHAQRQYSCADPACPRMQDQRTALLESVMELEAQRAELRAEMQPLWARHQTLTRSLPPCLQQVCNVV